MGRVNGGDRAGRFQLLSKGLKQHQLLPFMGSKMPGLVNNTTSFLSSRPPSILFPLLTSIPGADEEVSNKS